MTRGDWRRNPQEVRVSIRLCESGTDDALSRTAFRSRVRSFYSRFILSYMHAHTHAGTRDLDSSVLSLTQCPIKAAKRVRLPPCLLPSGRARITSIASKDEDNRDCESVDIVEIKSGAYACSNHLRLIQNSHCFGWVISRRDAMIWESSVIR